jgi:hypothetical protein
MTSEQNKKPDWAEKSNAEKWVAYLSAFDLSALRRPLQVGGTNGTVTRETSIQVLRITC